MRVCACVCACVRRCVVVLGLPYPNPTCPELRERLAFADRRALRAAGPSAPALGAGGGPRAGGGAAGRQLYEGMCMNAVNQCVGRVVRHRGDWAAVLLVDGRYVCAGGAGRGGGGGGAGVAAAAGGGGRVGGAPVERLPAWLQASLDVGRQDFGHVYARLSQFCRRQK